MSGLILASASAARAKMLRDAGVAFEIDVPRIDEASARASFRAAGMSVRDQADRLAEMKALAVSRRRPGLVLGSDLMLVVKNDAGEEVALDKADDLAAAKAHLQMLRGRTHMLVCAAVIARDGEPIWRFVSAPKLTMRDFSDAFLDDYLARVGDDALHSVGAYLLEGLGVQLFDRVEGDFFSVLGLPLLPVLAFLRTHAIIPA